MITLKYRKIIDHTLISFPFLGWIMKIANEIVNRIRLQIKTFLDDEKILTNLLPNKLPNNSIHPKIKEFN